jgi:sugar phosphate isomerase/epimerase
MPQATPPIFAVSSWSLHRRIGLSYPDSPQAPGRGIAEPTWGSGEVAILDLPADVARHGIDRLEICHFQLASRDRNYLGEMCASLKGAGVTLQTLLIDDGDLSHPDAALRERDGAWIACWIEAAAELGAQSARVVAGKQPPSPSALQCSVDGLRAAARRGKALGVRIVTENWFALTAGPKEVYHIFDRLEGEVGLLADTGNWSGATKYDDLAAIFARAERCHAKAGFADRLTMDREDYRRCIEAARSGGYQGPFALIFDAEGDEWAGIEMEREAVREVFGRAA